MALISLSFSLVSLVPQFSWSTLISIGPLDLKLLRSVDFLLVLGLSLTSLRCSWDCPFQNASIQGVIFFSVFFARSFHLWSLLFCPNLMASVVKTEQSEVFSLYISALLSKHCYTSNKDLHICIFVAVLLWLSWM